MTPDPFLDSTVPLVPGDAVGALILVDGRYLLQLRDDLDFIFFPGHWGSFGGGVDVGESDIACLCRELREELGLEVAADDLKYFSEVTFDMAMIGRGRIRRPYYVLKIDEDRYRQLVLGEGRRMQLFTGREVLALPSVTPYDRFILWLHIQQERLRPPELSGPK